jgi:hypothetical protein
MTQVQNTTASNAGEAVEQWELSVLLWECTGMATLETVWQLLSKLNTLLLYDPAVMLFHITQRS